MSEGLDKSACRAYLLEQLLLMVLELSDHDGGSTEVALSHRIQVGIFRVVLILQGGLSAVFGVVIEHVQKLKLDIFPGALRHY